ncbi:hypothetical protein TEA_011690 [Camellia sinensis var. sinensis]|uniref:Enoyl reductase (ER) domain-containing protein n=1 Tax=Camellia sinensis var. sinensis TaxID=542762 RepID=A0A4S4EAB4_CAMSN|nr:hypothetical protein TEA_011690 [Camellia sinensis var. sinensis]
MAVVESKEWYLSAYVLDGLPTSDHLKLRSVNLSLAADSIPDQHVALEILWISVDPYLRSIMSGQDDGLSLPQFQLNQAITAFGIGRVVGTKDNNFAEGDVVVNPLSPIAEYCVASAAFLRKIDTSAGIPLPDYLNSLGLSGFTAWVGIEVLGNPKPGSNVFISAAAGGVGMVAGKLAKLKGCRVVGSTGSDEKTEATWLVDGARDFATEKSPLDTNADAINVVEREKRETKAQISWSSSDYYENFLDDLSDSESWSGDEVKLLKDEFGYDDAFNYHTETDIDAALSKRFPDGIDIYFENVGGKMLEAVLNNVNKGARIPLCGMISQYNQRWTEREGVRNLLNMVGKEVRMEGFMVGSYMNRFGDFMKEMEGYIKEGKIISKHRIYNGIESFLESFNSMFSSSNVGKVHFSFSTFSLLNGSGWKLDFRINLFQWEHEVLNNLQSLSMSSILRGSEDCLIWKGENHGIFEGYHNLGDHLLCYSVDSLEFKKQCHIQKFRIETKFDFPGDMLKGDICLISLCRSWEGFEQLELHPQGATHLGKQPKRVEPRAQAPQCHALRISVTRGAAFEVAKCAGSLVARVEELEEKVDSFEGRVNLSRFEVARDSPTQQKALEARVTSLELELCKKAIIAGNGGNLAPARRKRFLCNGPHMVRDYPKRKALSWMQQGGLHGKDNEKALAGMQQSGPHGKGKEEASTSSNGHRSYRDVVARYASA